jgi:hypothetical protein
MSPGGLLVSAFLLSLLSQLLFLTTVQASNAIEFKEVLIIAGNFSFNGELTNLAQYDISTGL